MKYKQLTLFEDLRLTLQDAVNLTAEYLVDYFSRYRDVAIAFSGGKDSSATVSLVLHLIEIGRVPRPRSLTVIYADTRIEAQAYGGDEAEELNARTGCIGCPLTEKETALDAIVAMPEWAYLSPLKKLKPIYREMRLFSNRLQKNGERNQNGSLSANPCRKGPLTLEARERFLEQILTIQSSVNRIAIKQSRPQMSLINAEEEAFIRESIANLVFPNRWSGDEPNGGEMLPQVYADGSVQLLLW